MSVGRDEGCFIPTQVSLVLLGRWCECRCTGRRCGGYRHHSRERIIGFVALGHEAGGIQGDADRIPSTREEESLTSVRRQPADRLRGAIDIYYKTARSCLTNVVEEDPNTQRISRGKAANEL
jgi:hypothetical protein